MVKNPPTNAGDAEDVVLIPRWGEWLLYNIVLVSTVQQSGEYADIYPFFFGFLILMDLETVIQNEVT